MKKFFALTALLALVALAAGPTPSVAKKLGPPGGTIYAHDMQYKTIATPTQLPDHGRFDTIYVLGEGLANVADAAPGDMDYNGGRWEVRPVMWTGMSPTQFTNAEQVEQAAADGDIQIGDVAKRFECPLIKKH